MKNYLFYTLLFLFSIGIFNSQETKPSTTQPKRTYAKKTTDNESTPTTRPTRTYAQKEDISRTNSSEPPKRTYATKPEKSINSLDTEDKLAKNSQNNSPILDKIEKGKESKDKDKESKSSFWSWLFGKSNKTKTSSNKEVRSTETYHGHPVYTGPKGGKYYYNKNGNKTYIR